MYLESILALDHPEKETMILQVFSFALTQLACVCVNLLVVNIVFVFTCVDSLLFSSY